MDAVAIDTRGVDAGLAKFVIPLLVALVDENIVIDSAWNHVCDVLRGEVGVVLGRRLRIRGADRDLGRNRELLQSGCVHAEGLDDSWRHGKYGVDPFVAHAERRRRIERQLVAQMFRHHRIVAPAALEGRYFSGSTLRRRSTAR